MGINTEIKQSENRKKKKKSDAGYSLVELVVVVLIIAILAVSLAPQVFQWVENSRNSTDEQTKNTLLEYCGYALTERDAFAMVKDGEYELHIIKDDAKHTIYKYIDKAGEHIGAANVDQTDPYWARLAECIGVSNLEAFERETVIESTPEDGKVISIDVYIYRGGYTYGYLNGIKNEMLDIESS